ncbi:MAG: class IV adenylate cyclase [Bacteroidota bacterium]
MPQNLEMKAVFPDLHRAAEIAVNLGARDKGILRQKDIYFDIPSGRLKLRILSKRSCELIAYSRPNCKGGRYSAYQILPGRDAAATRRFYTGIFDTQVVVRKKRRLFLYKNARIHLDIVEQVGNFIEFEVVVTQGKKQARKLFQELVEAFGIKDSQTIKGSYSDMVK